MPTISTSVVIAASAEAVWDVIVDPVYAPRLFNDVLFMEARPHGKAVVGQHRRTYAIAGRRKIEILDKVTELVKNQTFVLQELPGGLFEHYVEKLNLKSSGQGTMVRAAFEYKVSHEYVGEVLNIPMIENAVGESLTNYLKHLKLVAELQPL